MKKFMSILLVLVMLLGMMAGCGSSDVEEQPEGPVKLEFWHSMGSATGELIQEIVDEFNATHTDIVVEAIYQGDYTTAGTKLQAAVAGGNAPHVVQVEITRVGMYASQDLLLDLTPLCRSRC